MDKLHRKVRARDMASPFKCESRFTGRIKCNDFISQLRMNKTNQRSSLPKSNINLHNFWSKIYSRFSICSCGRLRPNYQMARLRKVFHVDPDQSISTSISAPNPINGCATLQSNMCASNFTMERLGEYGISPWKGLIECTAILMVNELI